VNAAKRELRAAMKSRLSAVSADERRERSARATGLLEQVPAWRDAVMVLAFLSMPGEVDSSEALSRALADGKRVAVPRIDGDHLAFVELDGSWRSWPRDRWGIPQPPADAPCISASMTRTVRTVSLVPGLAFDSAGGRLGRGKGYYDRWLASIASPSHRAFGFGYAFQLVESVPMDEHDIRLDGVILG